MATPTMAIYAQSRPAAPRRTNRVNARGFGLAILATIGIYTVGLPLVGFVAGMLGGLFGTQTTGSLMLAGGVITAGAAGWFLRSWWWPLVGPLPAVSFAFLLYHWATTSNDPAAGFLVFGVVLLAIESVVIAVGAIGGVALAKLFRRD